MNGWMDENKRKSSIMKSLKNHHRSLLSDESNEDVYIIDIVGVMSYRKGKFTKVEGNDIMVERDDSPGSETKVEDGVSHYTKVYLS